MKQHSLAELKKLVGIWEGIRDEARADLDAANAKLAEHRADLLRLYGVKS